MSAVRPAWYRFRATFRRRWSGHVALALLVAAGRASGAVRAGLAAGLPVPAVAAPGQRAARTPTATVLRAE